MNQSAEHTKLVRAIRLKLGRAPGLVLWPVGQGHGVDIRGAHFRLGLVPGAADLIGIVQGMFFARNDSRGSMTQLGRFIALEVKTGKARQTKDQKLFQGVVESVGGYYAVVHSVSEAEQAVEEARRGRPERFPDANGCDWVIWRSDRDLVTLEAAEGWRNRCGEAERKLTAAQRRVEELEAEKLQLSDHFDRNAGLLRARVVENEKRIDELETERDAAQDTAARTEALRVTDHEAANAVAQKLREANARIVEIEVQRGTSRDLRERWERERDRAEALTAELAEAKRDSRFLHEEAVKILDELSEAKADAERLRNDLSKTHDEADEELLDRNLTIKRAQAELDRVRHLESVERASRVKLQRLLTASQAEVKRCAAVLAEWRARSTIAQSSYYADMLEAALRPDPAASETAGEREPIGRVIREKFKQFQPTEEPYQNPACHCPDCNAARSTAATDASTEHVAPAPEVKLPRVEVGPTDCGVEDMVTATRIADCISRNMRRLAATERAVNALVDELEKGRAR